MSKPLLKLIFIISLISLSLLSACKPSHEDKPFPSSYAATPFPIPEELLYILDIKTKGNSLYFLGICDISGNLVFDEETAVPGFFIYISDMSQNTPIPVVFPYYLEYNDDKEAREGLGKIYVHEDGAISLTHEVYGGEINEYGDKSLSDINIKKISATGTELFSFSIMTDLSGHENFFVSEFTVDGNGNYYIRMEDTVHLWKPNGELICSIPIGYIYQMEKSRAGSVYVIYVDNIGQTKLADINPLSGKIENNNNLASIKAWYAFAPGINSDLLLTSDLGIFEYDTSARSHKQIISFSLIDIVADFGAKVLPLQDGRIIWYKVDYSKDYPEYDLKIIHEAKDIETKETLVLGGSVFFISNEIRKAVADFNQTNPNYRIEIKEYGTDDYHNTAMSELNMDIMTNQAPDIIILPRYMSLDIYHSKGILMDLYPYLDNDENLKRSDFHENIVKAYERDEKLLGMPINFKIITMAMPKSAAGNITSWNIDELIAYSEQLLPDSMIYEEPSKTHVLGMALFSNSDSFINWGERNFDRDLLIKILNYADNFENQSSDDPVQLEKRIHDGKVQIMCCEVIGDFEWLTGLSSLFDEEMVFVGYPAENGSGNLVDSANVMAINEQCKDKDVAWQFISSMLDDEYQSQNNFWRTFPIRKSGLDASIERMKERIKYAYYTADENGNMIMTGSEITYGSDTSNIKIIAYPPGDEEIQKILDLINSADKTRSHNEHIHNIIFEEAGSFFSGLKTAQETADIIENRVRNYMNEME